MPVRHFLGVKPPSEEPARTTPRGLLIMGGVFFTVGFVFFGWAAWALQTFCRQSGPCMSPLGSIVSALLAFVAGAVVIALGVGRHQGRAQGVRDR